MTRLRSALRKAPLVAVLLAAGGCFNEPEPAYKSVPPENRVYMKDAGLEKVDWSAAAFSAGESIDYINLDRNKLTSVEGVEKFTGLKWLRLNDNKLSSLPDLKPLVRLRRIYLRGNKFESVPEALKDLPALTDVDLSGNSVKEVPEWLARKKGLKNLSFDGTRITSLPADLSAWESLQSLRLGELKLGKTEMDRIRKALPRVAIAF